MLLYPLIKRVFIIKKIQLNISKLHFHALTIFFSLLYNISYHIRLQIMNSKLAFSTHHQAMYETLTRYAALHRKENRMHCGFAYMKVCNKSSQYTYITYLNLVFNIYIVTSFTSILRHARYQRRILRLSIITDHNLVLRFQNSYKCVKYLIS